MDKKLKAYREYITAEYEKLDHKKAAPRELIEFHLAMVQHFQHERFVHLLVTVSFALLMLLCFMFYLAISLFATPINNATRILGLSMAIITLILFITLLFYIRHYYLLENGTQELEDMTRKLYGRDFFAEQAKK